VKNQARILSSFVILGGFFLTSCEKARSGPGALNPTAVGPPITGAWNGTVQLQNNGGTLSVGFQFQQFDVNLTGTYGPGVSCQGTPSCQGSLSDRAGQGQIVGITSGKTLEFTLKPSGTTCAASILINGQIEGTTIDFSLQGTDCNGQPIAGIGGITIS
jgi:hypothetical protein